MTCPPGAMGGLGGTFQRAVGAGPTSGGSRKQVV